MFQTSSSNQIECPRCGASVHYELTRCPECGLNFFPVDEYDEGGLDVPDNDRPLIPGVYLIAVIAGWMAFAVVAFLVHFVTGALTRGEPGLSTHLVLLIFDLGAALGAGVLTGYLADENQVAHRLSPIPGDVQRLE